MFSRRADWTVPTNRLTRAREDALGAGRELIDLTASNPTTAGIHYPLDEIADALAQGARATYDPQPLGIRSAREAVASELDVDLDDVVITASTSESYSFLFKLLGDPGDRILTPTPSYPLLEHLTALELLELIHIPMELHQRWELPARINIAERTRAIVIVNPNNPTGSYVVESDQANLTKLNLPLISDEVFFDYAIDPPHGATRMRRTEVLSFTLGGLSKSAGLPHLKLGWIVLGGPSQDKRAALGALELIADSFLSVGTPVQEALPRLLALAPRIRALITRRTAANLTHLRNAISALPGTTLLPVEGGWTAVLRVPRTSTDEELALRLLREQDLVVQPGYFFDFPTDGFLALSLLTPESEFSRGVSALVESLPR